METIKEMVSTQGLTLKILVMTSLYPPHFRGGAELSCQSHAEGLQERGHEVFILTSSWGVDTGKVEGNVYRLLNYDKSRLSLGFKKHSSDPLRLWRRLYQLRRALFLSKNYHIARKVVAATRPDVAYVWHMGDVSINPILAAQDLGIPIVFRLPDYWLAQLTSELCLEHNPLKKWYRSMLSGFGGFDRLDTSHLLPNSGAVMRQYLEAGFPVDRLHVIPNGLPYDLIINVNDLLTLPMFAQSGVLRLLFAGRVERLKGPDVAIQTLAHLKGELGVEQAHLDIIGEGPKEYESELRNMVGLLGLERSVSFLGRIDHAQLLDRYSGYDALLLTSRWAEPFSRTMMEAMGRGLPVVATNTGGTVEVISDGNNGLLVPPDDPMAMAMAVRKLLSDPGLVQKIRCNALATLREKYALERIIEQVEAYLQDTVLHVI